MKYLYKITFLLFLLPAIALANPVKKKHEKSKVIKKEFSVNADAKVALQNRYGNLNITTWNENMVEIEVTITVKGNDLDDVEDKLSSINVAFNASSSLVEAETLFEKNNSNWSWWKKSKNLNYIINYRVKMPKSNAVDLNNDYGNIYLDHLNGKAAINCDYGKIDIGKLSATDNKINLEYCTSSTINFMKNGHVNIDYSKLTIDNAKTLTVNADYSTFKVGIVKDISFNFDYGAVAIEEATEVKGNSDYTSMRFGTITKKLDVETDYGAISIKKLAKNFENVSIDAQYASVKIGVEYDIAFTFEIDLQYAGFSRNDEQLEFFKRISKTTSKYYEGKYGKGTTNAKLKIRSQYGGVSINEY